MVRTEILAGARAGEEAPIIHLLGLLRWLDVTPELADAAGRLAAIDYLIAAGVQHLDAELLTLHVLNFPMLAELRPAH